MSLDFLFVSVLILAHIGCHRHVVHAVGGSSGFSCTNFDSNSGAHFDLRELQRTTGQPSYRVEDGDIPCTKYVSSLPTQSSGGCALLTDTGYSAASSIRLYHPAIVIHLLRASTYPLPLSGEANYTYIFNICGAVQDGIPEKCDDLAGLNTAAALQVNTRGS